MNHDVVKSMPGFEEYLLWIINSYAKGAIKFQKDRVIEQEGKIIVKFVGRYERLKQYVQQVCQIFNIETSLPSINRIRHRDYKSYYNDHTIKMIEEHFKEDIELFGYTFDSYQRSDKYLTDRLIYANKRNH